MTDELHDAADWTCANGDAWSLRDDPAEASPVLTFGSVEVPVTNEQATLIDGKPRA